MVVGAGGTRICHPSYPAAASRIRRCKRMLLSGLLLFDRRRGVAAKTGRGDGQHESEPSRNHEEWGIPI
jgi:hypothetical protein